MEEELLRQILQELESQAGTSWFEVLQFVLPAFAGLTGGLVAAWVGHQAARRSYESQLESVRLLAKADIDKISMERRLEWRRERYLELVNALSEYIAGLDNMLEADMRYATAVFADSVNKADYLATYDDCRAQIEKIRSSGRLSEGRFKIGDKEIGDLVLELGQDAEDQYIDMNGFCIGLINEFEKSGEPPNEAVGYWPAEHDAQRGEIARRTYQISKLIEERISLTS